MSDKYAIEQLPLPDTLKIALKHPRGMQFWPLVKVGDTVKKNQLIARHEGDVSLTLHAPSSGIVSRLSHCDNFHFKHPVEHIEISLDGLDSAITPAPQETNTTGILRELGLLGLGGATQPSHLKWQSSCEMLIVNAVECEAPISCDDALLENSLDTLITTLFWLAEHLNIKEIVLALGYNKKNYIHQVEEAIHNYPHSKQQTIKLFIQNNPYPGGEEKTLIQSITGLKLSRQSFAPDHGIVCQNVATIIAIGQALKNNQPLIERIVTFAFQSGETKNIRLRFGTPISHCLSTLGIENIDELELRCGGYKMSKPIQSHMTIDASTNCLLINPKQSHSDQPIRSCIGCNACSDACPVQLLPQQLHLACTPLEPTRLQDYHLSECMLCGLCDNVCPSNIPLTAQFKAAKQQIRHMRQETLAADKAKIRFEQKSLREKARQAILLAKRQAKRLVTKSTPSGSKKSEILAAVARAKNKRITKREANES